MEERKEVNAKKSNANGLVLAILFYLLIHLDFINIYVMF